MEEKNDKLTSLNSIQDKVRKIRDFVTRTRVQDKLMKNKPLYLQLCSCMDTVSDTQQAIDAYGSKIDEDAEDYGELYLLIYGLLQSIFVQQDASIDMAGSLGMNDQIKNYPILFDIRETRSQSIGHPTDYTHKDVKRKSFNAIIQHSLNKKNFEIISYQNPIGKTINKINIEEIIKNQNTYIGEILDNILKEIKRKDQEHKNTFKNTKFTSCFSVPNDILYFCEKILAVLRSNGGEMPELGKFGIEGVEKSLGKFSAMLEERELKIETYPGIESVFNDCKYPVEKIKEHIDIILRGEKSTMDKEAVIIFGEYLFDRLKELLEMAEEIDMEYNS